VIDEMDKEMKDLLLAVAIFLTVGFIGFFIILVIR